MEHHKEVFRCSSQDGGGDGEDPATGHPLIAMARWPTKRRKMTAMIALLLDPKLVNYVLLALYAWRCLRDAAPALRAGIATLIGRKQISAGFGWVTFRARLGGFPFGLKKMPSILAKLNPRPSPARSPRGYGAATRAMVPLRGLWCRSVCFASEQSPIHREQD
jgi:hypothetical protein